MKQVSWESETGLPKGREHQNSSPSDQKPVPEERERVARGKSMRAGKEIEVDNRAHKQPLLDFSLSTYTLGL